jgi:hypothetical protein
MELTRIRLLFSLPVLFVLAGCGTPGAPEPPSLNIPRAVTDLKAVRKGTIVTLSWTVPTHTTDGALVRHEGRMVLWRTVGDTNADVGEKPLAPGQRKVSPERESLEDSIAGLLPASSMDFANYAVEVFNGSGKSAGRSNPIAVPLVATPAVPKEIVVKAVPQGVGISWNQSWLPQGGTNLAVQYAYRVMRRLTASNRRPVLVKEVSAGQEAVMVIDKDIEWGREYEYWVTPVTIWEKDDREKGEIEGEESKVIRIAVQDVFPPATPEGLHAVFSQAGPKSFIDLSWNPNTETDLAGYSVYRWTEGAAPTRISNGPVKTPAFRDEELEPGKTYFYSVSAVDVRNNESAKSEAASESVPKW